MSERYGIGAILLPLAVAQGVAVAAALLIHEKSAREESDRTGLAVDDVGESRVSGVAPRTGWFPRDTGLWTFMGAMILFHTANAPGGVYLGLFLKRDLHAPERMLAYAFIVSMVAWMLVVWPAGWLADRFGRKPLLIAGWAIMSVRLGLVALLHDPWLIVANQALDGLGNGLFAVIAAAWVTDRLADPRRSGEAQVIVGSCLVLGSALGPAVSGFLVAPLGYRGLFALLAGIGSLATVIVLACVPETLRRHAELVGGRLVAPMATTSDLSTTP
jgi:MFS family permease